MKKAIAIAGALFVLASACGTASVESEPVELDSSDVTTATVTETGTDAIATESGRSDDEPDGTTTTAGAVRTTTTETAAPQTARDTSAAGTVASDETTTTVGEVSEGSEKEEAMTGQVPAALMDQVLAHAEGHTGRAASTMTVVRAEAVTWPDGSLGCPEKGMQYTQALVPGYWVEIAVGDETLDYRLSDKGGMRLCMLGDGLVPPPRDDT